MDSSSTIIELFFTFIISFAMLFLLRKWAKTVGLVDKPNERKLHKGAVPLVGGDLDLFYFFVLPI